MGNGATHGPCKRKERGLTLWLHQYGRGSRMPAPVYETGPSSDLLVRHPRGPDGCGPSCLHFSRRLKRWRSCCVRSSSSSGTRLLCHFGLTKTAAPVVVASFHSKEIGSVVVTKLLLCKRGGHGPTADNEGHLPYSSLGSGAQQLTLTLRVAPDVPLSNKCREMIAEGPPRYPDGTPTKVLKMKGEG